MCRLTVYKGRPLLIGDLITNPNNSLILQSRDAAYHPLVLDRSHRRNILVNGDGFGVAWYGREIAKGSCLFKFVTPAWSNSNLRNIGDHVESNLIFAHIRAASSGHDPLEHVAVSHENCHPFKHGPFTFMHNGGVPHFCRIKLKLLNLLRDEFFQEIKGSTDSEHIFALFLTFLFQHRASTDCRTQSFTLEELAQAMGETIRTLVRLCGEPCSLNCCVTDGVHIVVTRFRNASSSPPSLYYNFGSRFVCEDGVFYPAGEGETPSDIVISSAPLSKVKAYPPSSVTASSSSSSMYYSSSSACYSSSSSSSFVSSSTFVASSSSQTNTGGAQNAPTAVSVSGSESEHDVCEEDVGSWILMPRNHMLLVRGDANDPSVVSSVKFEPILIDGDEEEEEEDDESEDDNALSAEREKKEKKTTTKGGKKNKKEKKTSNSNSNGSSSSSMIKSNAAKSAKESKIVRSGTKKVDKFKPKIKARAPFTKPLRKLTTVEEEDEDE